MGKSFKWDGQKPVEVKEEEPVYIWDGTKVVKKKGGIPSLNGVSGGKTELEPLPVTEEQARKATELQQRYYGTELETPDFSDPVKALMKPVKKQAADVYSNTLKAIEGARSESTRQQYLSPIQKAEINERQNREAPLDEEILFKTQEFQKEIEHTLVPDAGIGSEALVEYGKKNNVPIELDEEGVAIITPEIKDKLPKDNETINTILKRIGEYESVRDDFLKSGGDIPNAAVIAYSKDNPHFRDQLAKIQDEKGNRIENTIPEALRGKIINWYLNNKNVKLAASKNEYSNAQYEELKNNLLTDLPEYGANIVGNELSRAREAEGKNNWFANFAKKDYMDDLANRLYADNPQKLQIYNDIIRKDISKYIDAPGLLENFAGGAKKAFKGQLGSIEQWLGLKSEGENIYDVLKEESESVSSLPKGLHQFSQVAGDMLGLVSEIAATGNVTKGLGLNLTPAQSNSVITALTFYDDEMKRAASLYPTNPNKQALRAGLMTLAFTNASHLLPAKQLQKALGGVSGEIDNLVTQLSEKAITRAAAKDAASNIFKRLLSFGKEGAKNTLKGTGELTAITGFGQAIDKVMDLEEGEYQSVHPPGELLDAAKTALMGTLIPGMIAGASKTQLKDVLYDMSANPERFKKILDSQSFTDPAVSATLNEQKSLIDYIHNVRKELLDTDLSDGQKKSFLLQSANEFILQQRAEKVSDPSLKKTYEDQVKKSQEIKEGILNGMPEEEIKTTEEVELDENKLKEESDRNKLVEKGQESVRKLLEEKDENDKPVFKGIYRDIAKSDPLGFLKDISDQIHGIEIKEGENRPAEGFVPELEQSLIKKYGADVVNSAKELFPKQSKTEKNEPTPSNEEMGNVQRGQNAGQEIRGEGREQGGLETRQEGGKKDIGENEKEKPKVRITAEELEAAQPKKALPEKESLNIDFVIKDNPIIKNVGSKEDYYQYLKSVFPESIVNGKVFFHRGKEKISEFDKKRLKEGESAFYFKDNLKSEGYGDKVTAVLLDIKKPSDRWPDEGVPKGTDATIASVYKKESDIDDYLKSQGRTIADLTEYGVYSPEQIHILGSEKDIRDFKNWKKNKDAIPKQAANEMDVRQQTGNGEKMGAGNAESKVPATKEKKGEGTGEKEPPISEQPPKSTVYSERPSTELSHRGLQNIANEFSLPDVKTRDRKRDIELRKEATDTIDKWIGEKKYSENIERLVAKAENRDILTDKERVILEQHLANLSAELRDLNPKSEKFDAKLAEIKRLKEAGEITRSEAGAALRIPTFRSRPTDLTDYYVAKMESSGVNKLTPTQKETAEKAFSEISETEKAYQEKISELEAENTRLKAENEFKKVIKKTPRQKKDFKAERKDIYDSIKEKLKKARGESQATILPYVNELIAIAPDVAKLMKSYAEEGVTELAQLVKKIHAGLKESIPEITEQDVNDIIAGEYTPKKKPRSQLASILRDLKDEAFLINQLESLLRGEEPKTEKKRIVRNRKITELRNKIKDIKGFEKEVEKQKEASLKLKANEAKEIEKKLSYRTPEEKALDSFKERTKKQIKEVSYKLKTGDFDAESAPKKKLKLDKEAQELQDKLIKLKKEWEVELLKDEYEKSSRWNKIQTEAADVLGIPRSLLATGDFSGVFRQALLPSVSHPQMARKAAIEMFKAATSQKVYDRWFYALENSPRYQLIKDSKLALTDPNNPHLVFHEERFMNNLANKIPILGEPIKKEGKTIVPGVNIIKGSERAYSMYLNKMRVDLFNRFADAMQKNGKTWKNSEKQYKAMAEYVNNMTGRGSLGETLNKAAPILNQLFFSPRLAVSRFNTLTYLLQPRFWRNVPIEAKKDYFKSLIATAGLGISILALAKLNGAETEDDPRSPDFGKIKSGNTRWDIWGGHQQYIRLVSQFISGKRKSSTTGRITEIGTGKPYSGTRGGLLLKFVRGKLAPVPGLTWDIIEGENIVGDRLTTDWEGGKKEIGLKENIINHVAPLVWTGLAEAIKDQGTKAWFTVGVPSVFGVGTQTYDAAPPSSKGKTQKGQNVQKKKGSN